MVARAAKIIVTAAGLGAGYLLGCVLALQFAENELDQYSNVVALQNDASSREAHSLLAVIKNSKFSFCSDSEIAYFRELVFRSEYLKDAGRIQGGKIECSATAGHPARPLGLFRPDSPQKDGTIAYSNLVPVRDASLKRAGLQLGTAFVVFGSHVPANSGHFPMSLTFTMKDSALEQAGVPAHATPQGNGPDLTTEGMARVGDTLYATRCSTTHFNCVTASASVSAAFHGETESIAVSTVVGGLVGIFSGILLSFVFNRSQDLCQQLRRAIDHDKLRVVYQPIVRLANGEIVGAEALSRWNDEDGNAVAPDVFIKIAEEHGYIASITKLVLRHALRAFGETLRRRPDFRLSINVSGADLLDPAFLPMLEDSLKRTKVMSSSLVIEITERSTADNEVAKETIRNLQRLGYSIHIDDFGTGYSNLDKLLYLYADTIKIDKAFTKVIGTESVSVAILPQILSMAKSLNLDVIVEGVETERQADYFSPATDKMFGQGWLYGRPVPAEEFVGLLAAGRTNVLVPPEPPNAQTPKIGNLQVVGSRII